MTHCLPVNVFVIVIEKNPNQDAIIMEISVKTQVIDAKANWT